MCASVIFSGKTVHTNSLWLFVVGFHFYYLTVVKSWLWNNSYKILQITAATSELKTYFEKVEQALLSALCDQLSTICLAFWSFFPLGDFFVASPEYMYVLISSFIVVGIDGRFWSPAAIAAAECCSCIISILLQHHGFIRLFRVSYPGYEVWIISDVTITGKILIFMDHYYQPC